MQTPIARQMQTLGGVAHIQDLLARGFSRRQIAAMKNQGELIRPRIGWYVSPDSADDLVRAVRVGGMLGCCSAAATYGLPVPDARQLHVALDPNSSRLRSSRDSTVHPAAGAEPDLFLHWRDRRVPHERYRVGVLDCLMQLATCAPMEWTVAALDAARLVRRDGPLLDERQLDVFASWSGAAGRSAASMSAVGAESVVETFARLRLAHLGADVVLQQPIGRYRADIVIDGWLVIECDGIQHSSERQFAHDRRRDAEFAALGFRVLRFTYAQVMHQWDAVVLPAVLRALADGRVRESGSRR